MTNTENNGIFSGCLLLSDIDGTLVFNGDIPKRNLDAIKYFTGNGGMFSIATGRSVEATRPYMTLAGANCPAVVFNGAVVYDYDSETPILSKRLPESAKPILTDIVEKFPGIGAQIHDVRHLYLINRTDATDAHMAYEHLTADDISREEAYERKWTKLLFACLQFDEMSKLHEYAKNLKLDGCYFLKTSDIYFELTCNGVNKGEGLKFLSEHYGIDPDKIFSIGDYYNDVEMMQNAGISSAVAASPDDVKAVADFVAGECENGAVADFIEYLESRLKQSL